MLKVVGISSSPRKYGNTEMLLDKALEGARSAGADVEKIILDDLDFKPCQECGGCYETARCSSRDDMNIIYKKFEEADAFIIASPVFFGSLSAQAKMMIDRFNCAWIRKYVKKIPNPVKKKQRGAFICAGGYQRNDFFENAKSIVKILFMVLDIEYFKDMFCGGVDKKGAVNSKPECLKTAFKLGEDLVKAF